LTGYAEQIQRSLPTGGSAMETAEHREPYESRGSRTDLGAPGGESPPGDSTNSSGSMLAPRTAGIGASRPLRRIPAIVSFLSRHSALSAGTPEGHGLTFCGGLGGAGDAVEPDCSSLGSTRRHGPVAISGFILSKALHEFSVSSQS
jgi:hypothetical protein